MLDLANGKLVKYAPPRPESRRCRSVDRDQPFPDQIGTNDVNRNVDVANAPTRLGALVDRMIGDAPNALLVVAKMGDVWYAAIQSYLPAAP